MLAATIQRPYDQWALTRSRGRGDPAGRETRSGRHSATAAARLATPRAGNAAWRGPSIPVTGERTANVAARATTYTRRSEEHTSEVQSHHDLVCRLLLEKKKK